MYRYLSPCALIRTQHNNGLLVASSAVSHQSCHRPEFGRRSLDVWKSLLRINSNADVYVCEFVAPATVLSLLSGPIVTGSEDLLACSKYYHRTAYC